MYPPYYPNSQTFRDNLGLNFSTPDNKPPAFGTAVTNYHNGQPVQGWWNGSQFVPNK